MPSPWTFPRATVAFLRFLAIFQLLTAGLIFAPESWIAAWHAWLGLGPLPHDAVLLYVIRGGAFVQGAIGVLLWIMATDLPRYYPLVLAVAAIYLVSGGAFCLIDTTAGLPTLWCLLDSVSCFSVGALLLTLALLSSRAKPAAMPAKRDKFG